MRIPRMFRHTLGALAGLMAMFAVAQGADGPEAFRRGLRAEMEGRNADAVAVYSDLLAARPTSPEALACIGRLARMTDSLPPQGQATDTLRHLVNRDSGADPYVRLAALRMLADLADRDGDLAAVDAANTALGKLRRAWVSIPDSHTPALATLEAWDRGIPAWPSGESSYRLLTWRRGFIAPPPYLLRRAGPVHVATGFGLDRAESAWLILRSRTAARLYVDGRAVCTRDVFSAWQPEDSSVRVELSAGWHRIDVIFLMAQGDDFADLNVLRADGSPLGFDALPQDGRLPSPRGTVTGKTADVQSPSDSFAETASPDWALAHAAMERAMGRPEPARLLLESSLASTGAEGAYLYAEALRTYPGRTPRKEADGRARALLEAVLEGCPECEDVRHDVALLRQEEEEGLVSLGLIRQCVKARPEVAAWRGDLYRVMSRLGWEVAARDVLLQALADFPDDRDLLREGVRFAQRQLDVPLARTCALRLQALEPFADHEGNFLEWAGAYEDALEFFRERVTKPRDPDADDERQIFDLLVKLGRTQEALDWLERHILSLNPERPDMLARKAGLLDVLGRPEEALKIRERLVADHPEDAAMVDWRALQSGRLPLDDYTEEARDLIAQAPDPSVFTGADSVLLLDFGATRYAPAGDELSRYHQVIWVLTKAGIDREGEVRIPDGARLLHVRTIKKDGTVLFPEDIGGKDSISMPGLEPGDFIDIEYMRAEDGENYAPRSSSNNSAFMFQDVERPFWHTRLVVQFPPGVKPDILETRLPAPAGVRTLPDGWTEHDWSYKGLPRIMAEPASGNRRRFVPWVEAGFGVSWDDIRRAFTNYALDRTPWTPELEQRLAEVVGGKRQEEGLSTLCEWLQENVEGEMVSALTDPASTVLHGKGLRLSVAMAWLRHTGAEADWLLVQPNRFINGLPNSGGYAFPILRYRFSPAGSWSYLTLATQFGPRDYLPPELRGGKAMSCARTGPSIVTLPADLGAGETRTSRTGTMELSDSGDLTITAEIRFSTDETVQMRQALKQIPPEYLDRALEQFLGKIYPAGILMRSKLDGLEGRTGVGRLEYVWFQSGALRDLGDGTSALRSPFYPTRIASAIASLPERKLPLDPGSEMDESEEWLVKLPANSRITGFASAARTQGSVAWEYAGRETAEGFRLTRHLRLGDAILEPAAYPAFAATLRAFQDLEEKPVEIGSTAR